MQFLSTDTPSCFIESSISNRFHHFLYQSSSSHPRFPFFPSFHIKQARIDFRLLAINRPPLPTLRHLPHFQNTWTGTCNQATRYVSCTTKTRIVSRQRQQNRDTFLWHTTRDTCATMHLHVLKAQQMHCTIRDTVVAAQQYDHKKLWRWKNSEIVRGIEQSFTTKENRTTWNSFAISVLLFSFLARSDASTLFYEFCYEIASAGARNRWVAQDSVKSVIFEQHFLFCI